MPSLTNNTARTLLCLSAALWLSACASTGPGKAPAHLSKGSDSTAAGSLYAAQLPAPPQADAVIAALEQQVAATPRDAQAYLELGVAYRYVERFDEAMHVFEQALQLSEQPHLVRNEIGILYRTKGEFEQAEKVYLSVLAAAPDFHDAHFNLGILYDLYLRRPLDAQKHYQAYIRNAAEADERVEKWLVDLERRHQIDASASAGVVGE